MGSSNYAEVITDPIEARQGLAEFEQMNTNIRREAKNGVLGLSGKPQTLFFLYEGCTRAASLKTAAI